MYGFEASRIYLTNSHSNGSIMRFIDVEVTSDGTTFILFSEVSKLRYTTVNTTINSVESRAGSRIVSINQNGEISSHYTKARFEKMLASNDNNIFLTNDCGTFLYSNIDKVNIMKIWYKPAKRVTGEYLVGEFNFDKKSTSIFHLASNSEFLYDGNYINMIKDSQVMHLYTVSETTEEDIGFDILMSSIIPFLILAGLMRKSRSREY